MPGATRQQSRTGLPIVRSEISFRWSTKAKKQLLNLVKSNAEYRAAFFPTGFVVPQKSGIARYLLLELVKDEPVYLIWLEGRGLIKRDAHGRWIPLDSWRSTSYSNPVITQLGAMKKTYEDAYKQYKITSKYTSFSDIPKSIRADFKELFPWFFLYKELAAPTKPFERPPLRLPVVQAAPVTPVVAPARSVARPTPRAPPSPSPSDHSSSSPSPTPSPSPSLSPSPPPPSPPIVSLSQALPPLRPNPAVRRADTSAVLPISTRPYVRPNAVASSSRIPIKIESSSSSSSASSDSDRDMGMDSDTDSEHEMENDNVDMGYLRASNTPAPQRGFQSSVQVKRRRSLEGSIMPSVRLVKRSRVDILAHSTGSVIAKDDQPSIYESVSVSEREDALHAPDITEADVSGAPVASAEATRWLSQTTLESWRKRDPGSLLETRDRLMRQMRDAVGPFEVYRDTVPMIFKYAPELNNRYAGTSTSSARNKLEGGVRFRLFTVSLKAMQTLE